MRYLLLVFMLGLQSCSACDDDAATSEITDGLYEVEDVPGRLVDGQAILEDNLLTIEYVGLDGGRYRVTYKVVEH